MRGGCVLQLSLVSPRGEARAGSVPYEARPRAPAAAVPSAPRRTVYTQQPSAPRWCRRRRSQPTPLAPSAPRHGVRARPVRRRQGVHLHKHCIRDVQRRAAGDGGAAGVGPQHVHVVPLPLRRAVPRVRRLRAGGRPVAGSARLLGRHRRHPPDRPPRRQEQKLVACVRGGGGVPGGERGGVRRVDGRVAGGVVALRPAGRAGAPRARPAARPQARAARRRAVPRRRAPALRHDRGGGAGGAQQCIRHHRVRGGRSRAADSGVCNGASAGAPADGAAGGYARREGARGARVPGRRQRRRRARRRQRQRGRRRPAARLAQEGQPADVHYTRQDFLAGRDVGRSRGAAADPEGNLAGGAWPHDAAAGTHGGGAGACPSGSARAGCGLGRRTSSTPSSARARRTRTLRASCRPAHSTHYRSVTTPGRAALTSPQ